MVTEGPRMKAQFAAMCGFPYVIRVNDCAHVAIGAPSQNTQTHIEQKNDATRTCSLAHFQTWPA